MLTATKNSRTDSPERSRLFRFSARILIILGIFLVVWIYLGENGKKSSFVFQPNEIVEKSVVEVGEIIFKTGKTAKVENVYSAKEKRSISGNNLTLQGTVDGKIDLFLKPIIKSNSYELKIDLSESDKNKSSYNEEENESDEGSNNNNSLSSDRFSNELSYVNKKKKIKDKYIAQIEQLKNELKLEKQINNKLDDKEYFDEVKKLKKELNLKSKNLKILILSNKKQKQALNILTKEIEEINYRKENKENDEEIYREGTSSIFKIEDKEIYNALNKMNLLKKENEYIKNKLYENNDYNYQINLEDNTKSIKDLIDKLYIPLY